MGIGDLSGGGTSVEEHELVAAEQDAQVARPGGPGPIRVGDAGSVRSQISLGDLARECVGQPDGSTLVRVGVEAQALLGTGGSAGRYDVPVQIVVKDGSTVFANRSRRVAAAIPAGQTRTTVSVVEEGIVVPAASANNFEIEVGLGARAATGRRG